VPEHVLLALLRERDGVAVRVLLGAGVDPRRLREEVRSLAGESAPAPPAPAPPPAAGAGGGVDVAAAAADRVLGAYALLGVLAAGGPAAELLRSRGVDEAAVAALLRGG